MAEVPKRNTSGAEAGTSPGKGTEFGVLSPVPGGQSFALQRGQSWMRKTSGLHKSCAPSELMPPLFTGLAPEEATDNKSYTSILYGNGPGYQITSEGRPNVDAAESGKMALTGLVV